MDDLLPVVLCASLYIIGLILWLVGHQYISAVYIYIRILFLYPLTALGAWTQVDSLMGVTRWVMQNCQPDSPYSLICHADFKKTQWAVITQSSFWVNAVMLIPLAWMCVRVFWVSDKHPDNRFARKHTVDSFIKENKPYYPHLSVVKALDLIPVSLTDKDFRMAYSAYDFCVLHRLIKGFEDTSATATASGADVRPVIDDKLLALALEKQLGDAWGGSPRGILTMTTAELYLLAITMPIVAASDTVAPVSDKVFAQARKDSDELMRFLFGFFDIEKDGVADRSWMQQEPPRNKAIDVIKRYIDNRLVQELLASHAYNRTIIMRFFSQARRLGKLAANNLLWLRYYDKDLWYLVQSIGRPSPFVEAAGVFYHFLVEVKQGSAIFDPQIDNAIKGVITQVDNYKYTFRRRDEYLALLKADSQKGV
jgi:intracellular multiplication protein IcmP